MISNDKNGMTLIELIVVVAVTSIIAVAFTMNVVPLLNSAFFLPQNTRANNASSDALRIILEGDEKARGLRYTGPGCTIGGAGGGGSTITAASANSITYHYVDSDYCGGAAARTSHTVDIVYDSGTHVITRAIDGGTPENIPYYVTVGSGIHLDPPSAVNFFRYYNDQLSEMIGAGINALAIYRVDVTLASTTGTGAAAGQNQYKGGVDIKRYVPAPSPCLTSGEVCVAHTDCCSGACT